MIILKRLRRKKILKPTSLSFCFQVSNDDFHEKIKKLEEAKRKSWQDSKRIILD